MDIETLVLKQGSHKSIEDGACVMELVSYLAHEPFSDRPKCASPVISSFLRSWNDSLDDDTRQKLKPYASKLIGSVASQEIEDKRAWLATDWMVRTYLPAWLELAKLSNDAEIIRPLPEITAATITKIFPAIKEAQKHLYAAWDAAWDAAWAAARDAVWPTVLKLQNSAFDLLDRMIEAK